MWIKRKRFLLNVIISKTAYNTKKETILFGKGLPGMTFPLNISLVIREYNSANILFILRFFCWRFKIFGLINIIRLFVLNQAYRFETVRSFFSSSLVVVSYSLAKIQSFGTYK